MCTVCAFLCASISQVWVCVCVCVPFVCGVSLCVLCVCLCVCVCVCVCVVHVGMCLCVLASESVRVCHRLHVCVCTRTCTCENDCLTENAAGFRFTKEALTCIDGVAKARCGGAAARHIAEVNLQLMKPIAEDIHCDLGQCWVRQGSRGIWVSDRGQCGVRLGSLSSG